MKKQYRKKPVVIEAIEYDAMIDTVTEIIDWILANGGTARFHEAVPPWKSENGKEGTGDDEHIAIDTLEGTMRALCGDYIIRGVQGEFYPCKPDIFAATYEPVTTEDQTDMGEPQTMTKDATEVLRLVRDLVDSGLATNEIDALHTVASAVSAFEHRPDAAAAIDEVRAYLEAGTGR